MAFSDKCWHVKHDALGEYAVSATLDASGVCVAASVTNGDGKYASQTVARSVLRSLLDSMRSVGDDEAACVESALLLF